MFLKTRLETGSPVVTEKQIPVRPAHEHVKAPQVGPRGLAKLCHLGVCVCVSAPLQVTYSVNQGLNLLKPHLLSFTPSLLHSLTSLIVPPSTPHAGVLIWLRFCVEHFGLV